MTDCSTVSNLNKVRAHVIFNISCALGSNATESSHNFCGKLNSASFGEQF